MRIFNFLMKKIHNFPCQNCLVRASCNFSKPCDKLEMDNEKVKNLIIKYRCCPDCGSEELNEGPSGGISTNVQCARCGHWFNMCLPFSIERIHVPPGPALEGVEQGP